jgi:hypothetical protein
LRVIKNQKKLFKEGKNQEKIHNSFTRKQSLNAILYLEKIKKNEDEELKKKLETKKTDKKFPFLYNKNLINIVDSNIFMIFFMILTVFIMFIKDIQIGFLSASEDEIIDTFQTLAFFLFILEIIFTSFAKKDYLNSFFFWLDVVSTMTIIQDINFMFDPLLNLGEQ